MKKAASNLLLLGFVCFIGISCQFVEKLIDDKKRTRTEITTKVYEKDGLKFSYPDNWMVSEDVILEEGVRYIDVEDADNSLFIITLHKAEDVPDLKEYVRNFKGEIGKDIPLVKTSKSSSTEIVGRRSGSEISGMRQKFSISLLGETVPHTTDFFLIPGQKLQAIVTMQAPDEDLKAAEKEFQVIFDSMTFE